MCCKHTFSLIAQSLIVLPEQLQHALSNFEPYKGYSSSPKWFQCFCSQCSSSLIWRSEDDTSTIAFMRTLDAKWLVSGKLDSAGTEIVEPLAGPSGTQYWAENAVPGVTDAVEWCPRARGGDDASGGGRVCKFDTHSICLTKACHKRQRV